MERVWLQKATNKAVLLTTAEGKLSFSSLSERFRLKPTTITLASVLVPVDPLTGLSLATWKELKSVLGLNGTEEAPVVVDGDPIVTSTPAQDVKDVSAQKIVTIFRPVVDDEEVLLRSSTWKFANEDQFNKYCERRRVSGLLPANTDGEPLEGRHGLLSYCDIMDRGTYVEDTDMDIQKCRICNYQLNESKAAEDEFNNCLPRELSSHGFAKSPVLRPDLRLHCIGKMGEEQEFDAVVLDGVDKAFVGSVKHHAKGIAPIGGALKMCPQPEEFEKSSVPEGFLDLTSAKSNRVWDLLRPKNSLNKFWGFFSKFLR